jgi:hypothetical protein
MMFPGIGTAINILAIVGGAAIAGRQITKYYPEWKQLNIIRLGSVEEQTAMSTFIDACRSWSNDSSNTDPFGLDSLTP